MAKKKSNRGSSRKQFDQFKGKVVHEVEVHATDEGAAVGILFSDRTYLSFEVDMGVTIRPELSDFKTGEYRPLKRWPPISN